MVQSLKIKCLHSFLLHCLWKSSIGADCVSRAIRPLLDLTPLLPLSPLSVKSQIKMSSPLGKRPPLCHPPPWMSPQWRQRSIYICWPFWPNFSKQASCHVSNLRLQTGLFAQPFDAVYCWPSLWTCDIRCDNNSPKSDRLVTKLFPTSMSERKLEVDRSGTKLFSVNQQFGQTAVSTSTGKTNHS